MSMIGGFTVPETPNDGAECFRQTEGVSVVVLL